MLYFLRFILYFSSFFHVFDFRGGGGQVPPLSPSCGFPCNYHYFNEFKSTLGVIGVRGGGGGGVWGLQSPEQEKCLFQGTDTCIFRGRSSAFAGRHLQNFQGKHPPPRELSSRTPMQGVATTPNSFNRILSDAITQTSMYLA